MQTFEGVGLTKQKAKMAAAELALCRAFVQFRNVEPVSRILLHRRRDVTNTHGDVIDFSLDEPQLPTAATGMQTTFSDFAAYVSSPASLEPTTSSSASAAAAENDVSDETLMTS